MIRKKIMNKAESYESFCKEPKKISAERKTEEPIIPSKPKDNPDGLREIQIKNLTRSQAGVSAKYKKRLYKDIPSATREAIVRMYLVDHVFQADVAKYYKV